MDKHSQKGLLGTKGVRHLVKLEKGVTNMSIFHSLLKILVCSLSDDDEQRNSSNLFTKASVVFVLYENIFVDEQYLDKFVKKTYTSLFKLLILNQ